MDIYKGKNICINNNPLSKQLTPFSCFFILPIIPDKKCHENNIEVIGNSKIRKINYIYFLCESDRMDNNILSEYLGKIEELGDKDYLLAVAAYHAAPTIERVKPASVVTFSNNRRNLYYLWKKYKQYFLNYYGLDFHELKSDSGKAVVLFYDRNLLKDILIDRETMYYLMDFGYSVHMTLEEILDFLKGRFVHTFPHEIGIFLGFPLEDVKQFIEYPDKSALLYGYWKVFTNVEYAKFKFRLYDRAKLKVMKNILRESDLSEIF